MFTNNVFKLITVSALVFFAGTNNSKASLLQLSHDPLFLSQAVPPAIAVTFDDSGSMRWGFMGATSKPEWADPLQNRLYYNPNIEYVPPLNADGTPKPDSNFNSAWADGFNQGFGTVDLRTKYIPVSDIYYNIDRVNTSIAFERFPDIPGIDAGAIDDYFLNPYPTTDVNAGNGDTAFRTAWGVQAFYVTPDPDTAGAYLIINPTTAEERQNFANWYSYYNTRMKLARSAISRAFSSFGPDFKIAWQELNERDFMSTLDKFEGTHKQNFYDWLFDVPANSGTPLRSAFKRAGDLFTNEASYFSTDFNQTLTCQQNFHIAISDGTWNSDGNYNDETNWTLLHDENASTPALPGDTGYDHPTDDNQDIPAGAVGAYSPNTTGSPQQIYDEEDNLTSLSDITFSYWARDLTPGLKNNVKRYKKDSTAIDGTTIVFADDNEWANAEYRWNPKNNPAYWQNLVTYNVGLGLEASLVENYEAGNFGTGNLCPEKPAITDAKEAVLMGLRNGECQWPDGARIDDVWHSSINSRGDFFSANNPAELIEALNDVVNDILERISRGSASTISSGVITASTKVYSPGFDSSNWSGNILARDIASNGEFGDVQWDTGCFLTGGMCDATGESVAKQTRRVFAYDKFNETVESFSGTLAGTLGTQFALNNELLRTRLGVTDQEVIDYIIGEQGEEQSQGGVLRDRTTILADVVHSSPILVRGPGAGFDDKLWPDNTPEFDAFEDDRGYIDFSADQLNRENVLYIGGNGGMLHAIAAEGASEGQELWGFIPSKAFNHIDELADPLYQHRSFSDNTPVISDAFFDDAWKTVLVSGMRYGGQAFYALDVTDPSVTTPQVLWEFTDEDDADMGYSYGKASIVRISSTKEWVALIPNGYNNSAQDYPDAVDPRNIVSGTGHAVMYVVRLSDGVLLAKLDTGVGDVATPNGLATPTAVDSEFSIPVGQSEAVKDIGADYAYAGDVYGNLWRFDFSSPNYSDWNSAITRVVKADTNLYRPITIAPRVVAVPNESQTKENDVIVIYGTGKYIEIPDRSINLPDDQYMVGVIDGLDNTANIDLSINTDGFVEQALVGESGAFRDFAPTNEVDFTDATVNGWKFKWNLKGERLSNELSLLSDSSAVFAVTIIPSGDDPCEPGGESWLTIINPYTGATVNENGLGGGELFDIDGNSLGFIDEIDSIRLDIGIATGGVSITTALGGGGENIIIEGANDVAIIDRKDFTWRRRNWTNLLTE